MIMIAERLESTIIPIKRLVIDDFRDGEFAISLSNACDNCVDVATVSCDKGSMIGGLRYTWLHLLENRYGNQASARVSHDAFSFNNDARVYSELDLSYGFDCDGRVKSLHVDLSQWTHFKLWFECNDVPVNVVVIMSSGGGSQIVTGWPPQNMPPSNGPKVAVVDFSRFNGAPGFNWKDVDTIVFRFQRANSPDGIDGYFGSDFVLKTIEADFLP